MKKRMKKRITSFMLTLVMVFAIFPISMPTVKASGNFRAVQVAAGYGHSLAIQSDGSLWAWGKNDNGQLGDGTTTARHTPIKVMDNVQRVVAGDRHSLAVKEDGSLWAWGRNSNGQLGDGTKTDSHTPIKIMDNVQRVAVGDDHSLAVKEDGSLWAWGRNLYGQLGDSTSTDSLIPIKVIDNVKSVAATANHSLAIKDDGSLWGWGGNQFGQLGNGTTTTQHTPIKIMDNVQSVAAGPGHSLAVQNDGSQWAWGLNLQGRLGDGNTNVGQHKPIKVMDNVQSVAAGNAHSLVIQNDGSLWACGWNIYGQLGIGTTTSPITPIKVMDNVQSVAAASNGNHTLAIMNDGSLWSWGWNENGQLGDGTTINGLSPIMIWSPTPTPSDAIEFSLSSTQAKSGDQVELVVRKNGGSGMSSYHINLEYDENVLTPISTNNNVGGTFESNYNANDGNISMVWVNSSEITGSSDLATITFVVNNSAPFGTTTDIKFKHISAINNKFEELDFTSVDGKISLTGNLFGDVNEDGVVDSTDLALIMQHLVGKATLTNEALANANCYPDGNIDIKDAQMIARYLSGDPDIVLG